MEEKDLNDIEEDTRETEETEKDLPNGKKKNDLEEDSRETQESLEDLKKMLADKDLEIERLKKDLGEAQTAILNSVHTSKEEERNYKTLSSKIV